MVASKLDVIKGSIFKNRSSLKGDEFIRIVYLKNNNFLDQKVVDSTVV